MPRVTLKQIAKQTGVSTFAVSRALSGKEGVSEATRRLVQDAAGRLGYVKPKPPTQREISVVFYDLDNINTELRVQIHSGVQREAARLNKPVRSHWTHATPQIAALARSSAGLLLVGPHEQATIATVQAIGVPVVRLGWVDPLEQADQVIAADREGGQALIAYLIGLGHRCIAYVAGASGYIGRRERYNGAREMAERYPDVTLHQIHFEEQRGFVDAFLQLRQDNVHPTAFFCANDGLALTVVSEPLGLGYRIPDDVSVVGFGDFAAAVQISPQLTTVRVEGAEIGAVALRLLLERIATGHAPDAPARRILIASKIIERRSAGPRRQAFAA
jgi:LacI family transcriptional regulator